MRSMGAPSFGALAGLSTVDLRAFTKNDINQGTEGGEEERRATRKEASCDSRTRRAARSPRQKGLTLQAIKKKGMTSRGNSTHTATVCGQQGGQDGSYPFDVRFERSNHSFTPPSPLDGGNYHSRR